MSLFGRKPAEPWPLDVLTLEYLFSGQVDPPAQKAAELYLPASGSHPVRQLDLTLSNVRATGARPGPGVAGSVASFVYGGALVALIPRGEATAAAWDEYCAALGQPVAARVLVGPYAIDGRWRSPDGTLQVITGDRLAVTEATITRVDGAGEGMRIDAPRATVSTQFVETAIAG